MAIGIGAALLGSSLIGGISSFFGQRSANQANVASAQQANQFSAEQAALNRQFQSQQAQMNRDFQAEWAQKGMDFTERMSSTAAQRAVKDYEQAGINKMLVAGNPASTPGAPSVSGAMPQGSSAQGQYAMQQNPLQAMQATMGNAAQLVLAESQAAKNFAEADAISGGTIGISSSKVPLKTVGETAQQLWQGYQKHIGQPFADWAFKSLGSPKFMSSYRKG